MSDLIERLRKERSVYDAELCDEAAYEIERLESIIRATINGLKDFHQWAEGRYATHIKMDSKTIRGKV